MLKGTNQDIQYPDIVYTQDKYASLRSVRIPENSLYSSEDWQRVLDQLEFLKSNSVIKAYDDNYRKQISTLEKDVKQAYQDYKDENNNPLIFGFDSMQIDKLLDHQSADDLNLVVFVEGT
jgi:hypothetical protein